ncbi:MAG: Crp/Fnr family transcriptional regulator [Candidatus Acidiferrum sp.]
MRLPSKSAARYLDQDPTEHSPEVVNMRGQAMPVCEAGRPERKLIQRICASGRKVSFEKGTALFEQGQKARGIYLIFEGAARLSMGSSGGRALILEFAGAGSIVGLAENILGIPYEKTAASTEATNAFFLRRDSFLTLLQEDAHLAFEAAELLSERFLKVLGELKTIGLSESALQKLAVFVLGLSFTQKEDRTHIRLPGANQEDLARMIGIFSRNGQPHAFPAQGGQYPVLDTFRAGHSGFASFGENRKSRAGKTAGRGPQGGSRRALTLYHPVR